MHVSLEEAWRAWDTDQAILFVYVSFQKVRLTNAKTLAANECVELILILTLLGQTLKLTKNKIL